MDESEFRDWLSAYTDSESALSSFFDQKQFFRINTIKISREDFLEKTSIKCKATHYCGDAFELDEKIAIGKTWEYFLGWIYPQSLSSILVSPVLGPGKNQIVLDDAAAPGSKYSHMAMLMDNTGVLVGNDFRKEKISAIYATINRMNILNCIVTMRDGKDLGWKGRFDKVLLDAPCTALGSGFSAYKRWNPEHSRRISITQKKMLFSAYDALKSGGELVYSTCTYAKEENEEVVRNLLENVPSASLIDTGIGAPHEPGLSDYGKEFGRCCRIYPQHIGSEGFFIAKIRKGE